MRACDSSQKRVNRHHTIAHCRKSSTPQGPRMPLVQPRQPDVRHAVVEQRMATRRRAHYSIALL
jgi:hypothetical protein